MSQFVQCVLQANPLPCAPDCSCSKTAVVRAGTVKVPAEKPAVFTVASAVSTSIPVTVSA